MAVPDALPDSGRVWWKAQMRARREAVEAAGRPITAIHVAAFACAMVLMGACIGATSSWFQAGLKWAWAEIAGFDLKTFIPYAGGADRGTRTAGRVHDRDDFRGAAGGISGSRKRELNAGWRFSRQLCR